MLCSMCYTRLTVVSLLSHNRKTCDEERRRDLLNYLTFDGYEERSCRIHRNNILCVGHICRLCEPNKSVFTFNSKSRAKYFKKHISLKYEPLYSIRNSSVYDNDNEIVPNSTFSWEGSMNQEECVEDETDTK